MIIYQPAHLQLFIALMEEISIFEKSGINAANPGNK
jgi:hypothetical protein